MDDKLRTPTNYPDTQSGNRPLQPFPQTAYQQVQRSAPVDTAATLPHIGTPYGQQPPKKGGAKAVLLVLLVLIMLGAIAAAAFFYMAMSDAQHQESTNDQEVAKLKSENDKLRKDLREATVSSVADKSAVYGKLHYKMLSSYASVIEAQVNLSPAELTADKIAIEKAYKEYYKLPATDEPLKNKQIEVMVIYKEGDKTRALVYAGPTADDPANFMSFVRDGTTWKYAVASSDE